MLQVYNHLESLQGKYSTIDELIELLTAELTFTKTILKPTGGQTCGMPPRGDIICKHSALNFKCQLPVNRSELKTRDKLIEVFHLYLLTLIDI